MLTSHQSGPGFGFWLVSVMLEVAGWWLIVFSAKSQPQLPIVIQHIQCLGNDIKPKRINQYILKTSLFLVNFGYCQPVFGWIVCKEPAYQIDVSDIPLSILLSINILLSGLT